MAKGPGSQDGLGSAPMSLTIGKGPFGRAHGHLNFERQGPAHVIFIEDCPRRMRVVVAGQTVADTRDGKLLHETGLLPVLYVPEADVQMDRLTPTEHQTHCPFKGDASYFRLTVGERTEDNAVWCYREPIEGSAPIAGHLSFYGRVVDALFEEDELVVGHIKDPYHRVDAVRSSRHVMVRVAGKVVAESRRPIIVFETGLPPRYYLPADDVDGVFLDSSVERSTCAYKGHASYHHVVVSGERRENVVWSYHQPAAAVTKIAGHLCFDDRKVEVTVDGQPTLPVSG